MYYLQMDSLIHMVFFPLQELVDMTQTKAELAAAEGGKKGVDDVDKAEKGENGDAKKGPFGEYYVPVNEHKKGLR